MLKVWNFVLCTIAICLFINESNVVRASELNKEIPSAAHNSYYDGKGDLMGLLNEIISKSSGRNEWLLNENRVGPKHANLEELNAILNEVADEDLLNLPIRAFDKDKLQNSPFLQYILIRKQSILYYLQEKRSHDYNPRLGRSSMAADEGENVAPPPSSHESNTPLFAPRLGKKSLEFSPRLGRSFYTD